MSYTCDVLVLAAHPDDAELCCGGSILQLVAAGKKVVLCDMTRGETGTRGTPELRAQECEQATAKLGVQARINLGLPDAQLQNHPDCVDPVVEMLRAQRPRILLTQAEHDIHPDHVATGQIARRAAFLAGLANYRSELGAPGRPEAVYAYPGNDHIEPSFCVDISAYAEKKYEVIACYASQVNLQDAGHIARRLDPLERVQARDRYFGAMLGCRAAEPFVSPGPLRAAWTTGLLGPES